MVREDVDMFIESANKQPMSWKPTADFIISKERQPPESLRKLITNILRVKDHKPGENVLRHADSICQDICHSYRLVVPCMA